MASYMDAIREQVKSGAWTRNRDALQRFQDFASIGSIFAEHVADAVDDLLMDFEDVGYYTSQDLRQRIRRLAGDFCAVASTAIKEEARDGGE